MATYYNTKETYGSPEQAANQALQKQVGTLISNPSKRDIPGNLLPQFYSGKMSYEDLSSAINGTPTYDATKGPQINFGNGNTAYQGTLDPKAYGAAGAPVAQVADGGTSSGTITPSAPGFANGNSVGVNVTSAGTQIGDGAVTPFTAEQKQQNQDIQTRYQQAASKLPTTPAPASAAQGVQTAKDVVGPAPKTSIADNLVQTDPVFAEIQKATQDFFSPVQQRQSLTQEYQNLLAASGIQGLDSELLNMKKVMDGTEEDIRNEVTKAGGFATDSQVQALTIARNKQMVKNYNNLLETRNAKEQYLDKMMSLSAQDRQEANQRFDQMMNLDFKLADYQQKMQTNAQQSFQKVVDSVGYSGAYQAALTSGDPNAISRAEKLLGVDPGQLSALAALDAQTRAQKQQMDTLDIQAKKANIANTYSQIADRVADNAPVSGVPAKVFAKVQASPEYKTINAVLPAMQAIKAYQDAIDKYGTGEIISGEGKGTLESAYGNALAAWKTLAALGALSGADFGLAENAVPEPSLFTRKSVQTSKLKTSVTNAVSQVELMTKRLGQNYPEASSLLNQQLEDIRGISSPTVSQPTTMTLNGKTYTKGADGKYY